MQRVVTLLANYSARRFVNLLARKYFAPIEKFIKKITMEFPQQLTDIFEASEVSQEPYKERYLVQKGKSLIVKEAFLSFFNSFAGVGVAYWLISFYRPTHIYRFIGILIGMYLGLLRQVWLQVQSYRVPGALYLFGDKLFLISERNNHTALVRHSDIKEVLFPQNRAAGIIDIIEHSGKKHAIQCNKMTPKPSAALLVYLKSFIQKKE